MTKNKKKLQVELITLADYVILSRDGKLSIIGLFDRFNLKKLPVNWPRMFLVSILKGIPGTKYNIEFRVVDPGSKVIFEQKVNMESSKESGKLNMFSELIGFPITVFGQYKVEILSENLKIEEFEFTVKEVEGGSNARKKESTLVN